MKPLITVVVPCFNHGPYIEKTLRSVLEQTYANIELIALDDASTDDSLDRIVELCGSSEFKDRFQRVAVSRNGKNLGAHATINRGIVQATGEFVSILNSDDQYAADRFEALVPALLEADSSLGFTNYSFIDHLGNPLIFHPLQSELHSALEQRRDVPSLSFLFLRMNVALSSGNLLFRKSLYERVGGFTSLRLCHDWDFILQSIRYTEPVFVDMNGYRYRIHPSNSFGLEAHRAESETAFCLRRFFRTTFLEKVPNQMAPTRENWPGFFRIFLERHHLLRHYARATTGYDSRHKTVVGDLSAP